MSSTLTSAASKPGFKAVALAALCLLVGMGVLAVKGGGALLIESEESKTVSQESVYNRIRWISYPGRDVWMMQQSHQGSRAHARNWERLAIVVDKTQSPATARFFQLEPGPLEWKADQDLASLPKREFRVSCYMCHSNGPRAIRPAAGSREAPLKWSEQIKLMAWNLRIKTYGRIVPSPEHVAEDRLAVVPFRMRAKLENDRLAVKTCVQCHQEQGRFARGALSRQNSPSIQFMVGQGYMPPPGVALPEDERKAIESFTQGF